MRTEMSSDSEEKIMVSASKRPNKDKNADDEELERPRSFSLPNLVLVPEPDMKY